MCRFESSTISNYVLVNTLNKSNWTSIWNQLAARVLTGHFYVNIILTYNILGTNYSTFNLRLHCTPNALLVTLTMLTNCLGYKKCLCDK